MDHQTWTNPPLDSYKINVEEAMMNNKATVGIVVRNYNGDVVAVMTKTAQPLQPIQAIQALAILQGFSLAQQMGLSNFTVEIDCKYI